MIYRKEVYTKCSLSIAFHTIHSCCSVDAKVAPSPGRCFLSFSGFVTCAVLLFLARAYPPCTKPPVQCPPVYPNHFSRSFQSSTSLLVTTSSSYPQHEVDYNRQQQRNGQHGRTETVVEAALPSHANALRAPVESDERVDHGGQGDEGEETGADLADAVTEVEKADGQAAQDDGEVEP